MRVLSTNLGASPRLVFDYIKLLSTPNFTSAFRARTHIWIQMLAEYPRLWWEWCKGDYLSRRWSADLRSAALIFPKCAATFVEVREENRAVQKRGRPRRSYSRSPSTILQNSGGCTERLSKVGKENEIEKKRTCPPFPLPYLPTFSVTKFTMFARLHNSSFEVHQVHRMSTKSRNQPWIREIPNTIRHTDRSGLYCTCCTVRTVLTVPSGPTDNNEIGSLCSRGPWNILHYHSSIWEAVFGFSKSTKRSRPPWLHSSRAPAPPSRNWTPRGRPRRPCLEGCMHIRADFHPPSKRIKIHTRIYPHKKHFSSTTLRSVIVEYIRALWVWSSDVVIFAF